MRPGDRIPDPKILPTLGNVGRNFFALIAQDHGLDFGERWEIVSRGMSRIGE
jgi:hypothetical protein